MHAVPPPIEASGNNPPIYLTPREREVLLWCAYGKTSWEIGQIIGCKAATVNFHVGNILSKLGAHNRREAAAIAARQSLV